MASAFSLNGSDLDVFASTSTTGLTPRLSIKIILATWSLAWTAKDIVDDNVVDRPVNDDIQAKTALKNLLDAVENMSTRTTPLYGRASKYTS